MFGTIRKHQTWLWVIIIIVIIISFVVFFSPYTGMDQGRAPAQLGSINGQKVTEEQYVQGQRDVMLQYFFMSGGRWPDEDARQMGFDIERETYQWLLLQDKAEQYNVQIASETVAQLARDMTGQFQRAGVSTPQAFIQQVLAPRGFSAADFERFLRRYLSIQQLMAVVGVSGKLVPPEDMNALYARERQELQVQAVSFPATNFIGQVTVTPETLTQFYSNRLAAYRLPERVQVDYVLFPISNHLAKAEAELSKTNFNEQVDIMLQRLGTNYVQFGSTPEEAKAKIRDEMIRNRALPDARREAAQFASDLFDMTPVSVTNLRALAEKHNKTVQTSEPFDRDQPPAELKVPQTFVTEAFSLDTTNQPFGPPVVGEEGVYVMSLANRLKSEVPSFDAVRAKVEQDYRFAQASMLAFSSAIAAHQTVTNLMGQGKDFAAAAAEANVQPEALPPFSLSTRALPALDGRIQLGGFKQLAFSTEVGKVSPVDRASESSLFIYVQSRLPVDETKRQTEMPNFARLVRQTRQNEAFNQWFGREAAQGLRDTPLGQPRPAPEMGAAPGSAPAPVANQP